MLDWTENDKMHQCASSENLARLGLRVSQKVKKSLFTQPTTKPLLKSEAKWVEILLRRKTFTFSLTHFEKSTDYFG